MGLVKKLAGLQGGTTVRVALKKSYVNAWLLALSPDGRRGCLSLTANPVDSYRFQMGKWFPKVPSESKDRLGVIDLSTGNFIYETAFRGKVFPASFFADGRRLYAEAVAFKADGKVVQQRAVINLETGERSEQVAPWDFSKVEGFHAIRNDLLLVERYDRTTHKSGFLAEVIWPTLDVKFQVEYETRARESDGHDFEKYFSADRGTLAYAFDHVIVCRRTDDLRVLWTREIDRSFFGAWRLSVSADGRYFAAAVTDSPFSNKEKRYYVSVHNGQNGEELTRFAISGTDGVAISPDGKLLAAAHVVFDKRGAVPTVFIHNVATGEQSAILEHAPVVSNAFMNAAFGTHGLAFSADGRYLVTSTNETRVWSIEWT